MPSTPMRPCSTPGCSVLVEHGKCAEHVKQYRAQLDSRRDKSADWLYDTQAWRKGSKAFLKSHPLCQCNDCDEGRIRLRQSTVVDHTIPHKGDRGLFWDRSNWKAMAKPCHDRKTAREDGGFGRG